MLISHKSLLPVFSEHTGGKLVCICACVCKKIYICTYLSINTKNRKLTPIPPCPIQHNKNILVFFLSIFVAPFSLTHVILNLFIWSINPFVCMVLISHHCCCPLSHIWSVFLTMRKFQHPALMKYPSHVTALLTPLRLWCSTLVHPCKWCFSCIS
jgi:hypothetical protein